jgi:hypothetical protein
MSTGAANGEPTAADIAAGIAQSSDPLIAALVARINRLEGRLEATGTFGHKLDLAQDELLSLSQATTGILLPMDASWILTCATLVFLMQLGFAQLEAGLVRPKNVVATYMKNIIDFVLGALSALLFGYGIAYAQWPLLHQMDAWKFFFHLVFQATASTIVSGVPRHTLAAMQSRRAHGQQRHHTSPRCTTTDCRVCERTAHARHTSSLHADALV